jgi:hypothetical protein
VRDDGSCHAPNQKLNSSQGGTTQAVQVGPHLSTVKTQRSAMHASQLPFHRSGAARMVSSGLCLDLAGSRYDVRLPVHGPRHCGPSR